MVRIPNFRKLLSFTLLAASVFLLLPSVVSAQVAAPMIMTYQGRLFDANGVPLTDSSVDMVFQIYDSSSGGSCLWSNSSATCASSTARSVSLTDGLFTENLGDTGDSYAALSDGAFYNDSSIYLQVTVEGEVLSPRRRLTASPYAINANYLQGYAPDSSVGTNEIVRSSSAGKISLIGATGIDGTNTNAAFRIDVSSADASSVDDVIFAVTLDSAATTPFAVGPDGITIENRLVFSDTGTIYTGSADSLLIDPGTTGDVFFNLDDASNVNFDLSAIGTGTTTLSLLNIASLSAADWGSATSVTGINLDLDTNIDTDSVGTLVGLYIGGDTDTTSLTTGVKVDEADRGIWFTGGVADDLYADEELMITTADVGQAVYIDPSRDDGIREFTAYTRFANEVDDGADSFVSVVSSNSIGAGLFRVVRENGAVDYDGTGIYIDIQETSAGSDGWGQVINNMAGGNSTSLYIYQDTTNSPVIDVQTGVSSSANVLRFASGGADVEFRVTNNGNAFVDGAFTGGGADYAEYFESTDGELGDYEVTCVDPWNDQGVKTCAAGERNIVGVISTNPGFIGNNIPGADGSLNGNGGYRLVGLTGQIETNVSAADGAIAIGDPITTSSLLAGYGGKATTAGYILGRALEPLASGTGRIRVLVQPMWWAGEMFADSGAVLVTTRDVLLSASETATAAVPGQSSAGLSLVGSGWNGTVAESVGFTVATEVTSASAYELSVRDTSGTQVFALNQSGDVRIAGRFFPADRGIAQDDAFIYYDSNGPGYMRTNAAGWSVGSYDFAESFPSPDGLSAGEVVVFGSSPVSVERSSGETYDDRIAGIVSTRPGFLAGEIADGVYPIALSGRVPAKVTNEGGVIAVGDPLTTSSTPGVLMKAGQPGPIVGYALEGFTDDAGMVTVFVHPTYFDGVNAPGLAVAPTVTTSFAGAVLGEIGGIEGMSGLWRIAENGDMVTRGEFVQVTQGRDGGEVRLRAALGTEQIVQLSGTATLVSGRADIDLGAIDPKFVQSVSDVAPLRIFLTPHELHGAVAATNRSVEGFSIVSADAVGMEVDWLVIGVHKDAQVNAPPAPVIEETPIVVDPPVEETLPVETPAEEEPIVNDSGIIADDYVAPSSESEPEPEIPSSP